MDRFLSSVDHIVATSPNYASSSPVLRRHARSVSVIPLGLDERDYPRAGEAETARWRTRFPRPFFLFVGVLRYYKGLHALIDAARSIEADVVIAGSGPLEAHLTDQARRIGAGNVHFVGAVPDEAKAALLDLCTAFVFPSHLRSEAFGLSLIEAAMFGKPMVTCEIGTGTSFVNIDRRTGLVVPPDSPEALAAAMRALLSDGDLTRDLGRGARARYESELTATGMVDRYVALYEAPLRRARI
jgi:rhamnosyl/mannosyltransferase